jgi:L-rhamnose mutarotase
MKRHAFKMKLKPGMAAEYQRRHDEIWPELARELRAAGVSDYSIFFDEETLRACLKIMKGAVFAEKAEWRGATRENIPGGSSTEEQRSQTAFSAKTLRAAGLLPMACVGSAVTARCGDAPASPPWPRPKSLAAAPFRIFRQALTLFAVQKLDDANTAAELPNSPTVRRWWNHMAPLMDVHPDNAPVVNPLKEVFHLD